MCGINGIVGNISKDKARYAVQCMNNAMQHRGPNDEGVFADDNIAFGHRRLSIIDLSDAGHQPIASQDGRYQMIFNGEIYNYLEVKKKLESEGHHFTYQTKTDSEVLLNAFIIHRENCLHLLNGMFAFAIYDNQTKQVFIARDRLGIKPIYYSIVEGCFLFASEVRSLLATNMLTRKLDKNSLSDYLRYQTVHAPNTILEGVKMIMPGHFTFLNIENISDSKLVFQEYWNVNKPQQNIALKSYSDVCENVRHLLGESVKRRLVSDVPFGAFLSGGIDSSAVVGLMSEVSNSEVKTFSVTFDEEEFSEAKYARMIAKKFNTTHTEIKLTPNDFIHELPMAIDALDHPSGDGPNTYIVSKATKNAGITMALSGLGGDELFCGYDVFSRMKKLSKLNFISKSPNALKSTASSIYKLLNKGVGAEKIAELLEQPNFDFENIYPLTRQLITEKWISSILKPDLIKSNEVKKICELNSELFDNNHIYSLTSVAEISTYMQNVLLRDTDQMSMAVALEVRVPFLDYTLVEYVLGLNDSIKKPTSPKKLLVDSLGDLLPSEIVNRKKMGFTLPWKPWMKNELKNMCEENIYSLSNRDYFNTEAIQLIWKKFLSNDKSITWSRVWYLVILEQWMQKNNIT